MKSTLKFVFPILCSLAFFACKNNTSAEAGDVSTDKTGETTVIAEDEVMEEDGEWELTFHKASELKASALFSQLQELVFYEASEIPEESDEDSEGPWRFEEITQFYPLGWSKDGNFAYAEYATTYDLGHQIVYTIKNMHSGDTLWSQEMTYGMAEEGAGEEGYGETESSDIILIKGGESEAELFKYAWAASEKALPTALKKAGIVVNPSGQFLEQTNYQGISFTVEEQETQDENNPMKYFLKSNKHEPLLIWEDYFPVDETKVVGVIKSPYSETIAVVVRQKRQLFEMTYGVLPILVGYNLN